MPDTNEKAVQVPRGQGHRQGFKGLGLCSLLLLSLMRMHFGILAFETAFVGKKPNECSKCLFLILTWHRLHRCITVFQKAPIALQVKVEFHPHNKIPRLGTPCAETCENLDALSHPASPSQSHPCKWGCIFGLHGPKNRQLAQGFAGAFVIAYLSEGPEGKFI